MMGKLLLLIIFFLFLFLIGFGSLDYRAELNGSNTEEAEFCRSLGYVVENEISFIFDISCSKFENGIKTRYNIIESPEGYDSEYKYYLVEPRK